MAIPKTIQEFNLDAWLREHNGNFNQDPTGLSGSVDFDLTIQLPPNALIDKDHAFSAFTSYYSCTPKPVGLYGALQARDGKLLIPHDVPLIHFKNDDLELFADSAFFPTIQIESLEIENGVPEMRIDTDNILMSALTFDGEMIPDRGLKFFTQTLPIGKTADGRAIFEESDLGNASIVFNLFREWRKSGIPQEIPLSALLYTGAHVQTTSPPARPDPGMVVNIEPDPFKLLRRGAINLKLELKNKEHHFPEIFPLPAISMKQKGTSGIDLKADFENFAAINDKADGWVSRVRDASNMTTDEFTRWIEANYPYVTVRESDGKKEKYRIFDNWSDKLPFTIAEYTSFESHKQIAVPGDKQSWWKVIQEAGYFTEDGHILVAENFRGSHLPEIRLSRTSAEQKSHAEVSITMNARQIEAFTIDNKELALPLYADNFKIAASVAGFYDNPRPDTCNIHGAPYDMKGIEALTASLSLDGKTGINGSITTPALTFKGIDIPSFTIEKPMGKDLMSQVADDFKISLKQGYLSVDGSLASKFESPTIKINAPLLESIAQFIGDNPFPELKNTRSEFIISGHDNPNRCHTIGSELIGCGTDHDGGFFSWNMSTELIPGLTIPGTDTDIVRVPIASSGGGTLTSTPGDTSLKIKEAALDMAVLSNKFSLKITGSSDQEVALDGPILDLNIHASGNLKGRIDFMAPILALDTTVEAHLDSTVSHDMRLNSDKEATGVFQTSVSGDISTRNWDGSRFDLDLTSSTQGIIDQNNIQLGSTFDSHGVGKIAGTDAQIYSYGSFEINDQPVSNKGQITAQRHVMIRNFGLDFDTVLPNGMSVQGSVIPGPAVDDIEPGLNIRSDMQGINFGHEGRVTFNTQLKNILAKVTLPVLGEQTILINSHSVGEAGLYNPEVGLIPQFNPKGKTISGKLLDAQIELVSKDGRKIPLIEHAEFSFAEVAGKPGCFQVTGDAHGTPDGILSMAQEFEICLDEKIIRDIPVSVATAQPPEGDQVANIAMPSHQGDYYYDLLATDHINIFNFLATTVYEKEGKVKADMTSKMEQVTVSGLQDGPFEVKYQNGDFKTNELMLKNGGTALTVKNARVEIPQGDLHGAEFKINSLETPEGEPKRKAMSVTVGTSLGKTRVQAQLSVNAPMKGTVDFDKQTFSTNATRARISGSASATFPWGDGKKSLKLGVAQSVTMGGSSGSFGLDAPRNRVWTRLGYNIKRSDLALTVKNPLELDGLKLGDIDLGSLDIDAGSQLKMVTEGLRGTLNMTASPGKKGPRVALSLHTTIPNTPDGQLVLEGNPLARTPLEIDGPVATTWQHDAHGQGVQANIAGSTVSVKADTYANPDGTRRLKPQEMAGTFKVGNENEKGRRDVDLAWKASYQPEKFGLTVQNGEITQRDVDGETPIDGPHVTGGMRASLQKQIDRVLDMSLKDILTLFSSEKSEQTDRSAP